MKKLSQAILAGTIALGNTVSGAAVPQIMENTSKSIADTIPAPILSVRRGVPKSVIYKTKSGEEITINFEICTANADVIKKMMGVDSESSTLVCASGITEKSSVVAVAWKTTKGISFLLEGSGTPYDGITYFVSRDENISK